LNCRRQLNTDPSAATDLRQQTYAAYRANLGTTGEDLPANFSEVVAAVTAFADVLASEASAGTTWSPQQRQWTRTDR
jgi:hypothetical protein